MTNKEILNYFMNDEIIMERNKRASATQIDKEIEEDENKEDLLN